MKRIETIKIGDEIRTISGFLKVTGYNGDIVWCEEYEPNEDDDLELTNERMLTLYEIGLEMRAVDGDIHHLVFEAE